MLDGGGKAAMIDKLRGDCWSCLATSGDNQDEDPECWHNWHGRYAANIRFARHFYANAYVRAEMGRMYAKHLQQAGIQYAASPINCFR